MFNILSSMTKAVRKSVLALISISLLTTLASSVTAQTRLSTQYPELDTLLKAFDVTQGALLERVVAINEDPSTQAARNELEEHFNMLGRMSMSEMMAMGMHNMEMIAEGPYDELEASNRAELLGLVRANHSDEVVQNAFSNSEALDRHTAEVLKLGREFVGHLYEIYLDDSISNKQQAVDRAIQDYLSDDRHSLPVQAKSYDLVAMHPNSTAFPTGFPKLSGLLWSNQWLRLAALEAIIVESVDNQFQNSVPITIERYWNKVGSDSGMTMFPAPSDIPMAATITPHLYSFHPQASIIVDNLNLLESIIVDILAYPNTEDRQSAIDSIVNEFTNKDTNFYQDYDYLLYALRGGIYNQGGPAIGDLDRSERNRSRDDMDHQHAMTMSAPQ